MTDPRDAAARYRQAREAQARGEPDATDGAGEASPVASRGASELERAALIETAIQQAIRRGEFDDLPGAGKPLTGLGATHDPDWWIRRKIEAEKLTGLGPPALTLRTEHADLATTLDALRTEADVREYVQDFNARVIAARRQLLGGPPVVTPTLDEDAQVRAWHNRRDAAARAAAEARTRPDRPPRPRWRDRLRRAHGPSV